MNECQQWNHKRAVITTGKSSSFFWFLALEQTHEFPGAFCITHDHLYWGDGLPFTASLHNLHPGFFMAAQFNYCGYYCCNNMYQFIARCVLFSHCLDFFFPVLFCIEGLRALVLNPSLLNGSKQVVIGFGTKARRGGDLGRVYFNVKIWVKLFYYLEVFSFSFSSIKPRLNVALLFHRCGCVEVAWRTSLALELVISTESMFHTRFPQESAWQE